MPTEILGVIVGGAIGILGGVLTTTAAVVLANRGRYRSIRAVAIAEITAIQEKATRYIEGNSTAEELRASTPLLSSIANEFGFLKEHQAVSVRRAITLDMEMRVSGEDEKVRLALAACRHALEDLAS